MKNMNISEDAMKIILENAAWDRFGIKVDGKQQITESAQEVSEEEEVVEEEHVCPLCSSHLQEAISDEALMEHTANILEAVNAATLNEETDEDDDDSDEYDEEVDEDEDEDQVEEAKMPAQLQAAMKKKKGKMPKGMK